MEFPTTLSPRLQKSVLTRAKIGHGSLTHAYLMSKYLASMNNKCQINLTIRCIIQKFPYFQNTRKTLSMPDDLARRRTFNEDNSTKI